MLDVSTVLERFAYFLAACGFAPGQRFQSSPRSRERPTITRIALLDQQIIFRASLRRHSASTT